MNIDCSNLIKGAVVGVACLYDIKKYTSKEAFQADKAEHLSDNFSNAKYGFLLKRRICEGNKEIDSFTLTRNCLEYLMSIQRAFVSLREDVSAALKDLERFFRGCWNRWGTVVLNR